MSAEGGGQQFGPFELICKIAQGGMAEIFLARETGIGRQVVVKRILSEMTKIKDFVVMFADEARLATRFSHPNVAHVYSFGEVDGVYYLSMEYVDGLTVSQLVRRLKGERIPLEITLRVISDVCAGLHYAHELTDTQGRPLGVVHRDVSPQNVMISRSGVGKLIDFGVARAATQVHVTEVSQVKGKLAYMAPEILTPSGTRQIDRRGDVFSTGVLLFEMVTGARLFRRENEAAKVLAVKRDEPRSVAAYGAPALLDPIIAKAVAKDPEARYQTAQELQDVIEELIAERQLIATPYRIGQFVSALIDEGGAREGSLSMSFSGLAGEADDRSGAGWDDSTALADSPPQFDVPALPDLPTCEEVEVEVDPFRTTRDESAEPLRPVSGVPAGQEGGARGWTTSAEAPQGRSLASSLLEMSPRSLLLIGLLGFFVLFLLGLAIGVVVSFS